MGRGARSSFSPLAAKALFVVAAALVFALPATLGLETVRKKAQDATVPVAQLLGNPSSGPQTDHVAIPVNTPLLAECFGAQVRRQSDARACRLGEPASQPANSLSYPFVHPPSSARLPVFSFFLFLSGSHRCCFSSPPVSLSSVCRPTVSPCDPATTNTAVRSSPPNAATDYFSPFLLLRRRRVGRGRRRRG